MLLPALVPMVLLVVGQQVWNWFVVKQKVKNNEPITWLDIGEYPFRDGNAIEPGSQIKRWPDHNGLRREIYRSQLIKLFTKLIFGAGVVAIAIIRGASLSSSAVVFILYAFYLGARQLDYWNFISGYAVRFWMLVLLIVSVCLAFLVEPYWFPAPLLFVLGVLFISGIKGRDWCRIAVWGAFSFYIAFSLIGDRGSDPKWKQGSNESWRLEESDWPISGDSPLVVMAASGGGSRAAIYTALTLTKLQKECPKIAKHLQLISSVSGGSLANAAYVARMFRRFEKTKQTAEGKPLEDSMSGDFLWPTLVGAIHPFSNRGREIENAWQIGDVGLSDLTLKHLAVQWKKAKQKTEGVPFPVPLFNSASLQGHAVVLSPLSKEMNTRKALHAEASCPSKNHYQRIAESNLDPTWVYYRTGIYGLEDLVGGYNPSLAAAVRASANFPFGFPLVRITSSDVPMFSPNREQTEMRLTDGGALSNSGIWSLFQLLMNESTTLRPRGVLLIVVEAGKMPAYSRSPHRWMQSLLGTIDDQAPRGQYLHHLIYELLRREYKNHLAVVQVDLEPEETYNIMTTWSLDGNTRKLVIDTFECRWPRVKKAIKEKWAKLSKLPTLVIKEEQLKYESTLLKNDEWWWRSPLH